MVRFNLLSLGFFGVLICQSVLAILIDWLNYGHRRRARARQSGASVDSRELGQDSGAAALQGKKIWFTTTRKALRDAMLIVLILSGYLNHLDSWVRHVQLGFVVEGTLFFAAIVVLFLAIDLPFHYYLASELNQKGTQDSHHRTGWVTSALKQWAPRIVVVSILSFAGLCLIRLSPDRWWLWGFLAGSLVQFYLTVLYPSLIEPFSRKAEPIQDPDFLIKLDHLAQTASLENCAFFRMGPKARDSSSAYCVGLGRIRRIFLSDRMLSTLTEEEILALVAHEIGHFKGRHILQTFIFGLIVTFVVFICTYLIMRWSTFSETFGFGLTSVYPTIFAVAVFWRKIGFFFKPFYMGMLRHFERQADAFVATIFKSGVLLASALQRTAAPDANAIIRHPLYEWFHSSHPPLQERIRSLEKH